MQLKLIN